MKFLDKKIYITLFLLIILLFECKVLAKDNEIQYTRENISNYFLGIISVNQDNNNEAFKYLKKVKSLKNRHILNLTLSLSEHLFLLEKFNQAFNFFKKYLECRMSYFLRLIYY